jgi:hypothetical protein
MACLDCGYIAQPATSGLCLSKRQASSRLRLDANRLRLPPPFTHVHRAARFRCAHPTCGPMPWQACRQRFQSTEGSVHASIDTWAHVHTPLLSKMGLSQPCGTVSERPCPVSHVATLAIPIIHRADRQWLRCQRRTFVKMPTRAHARARSPSPLRTSCEPLPAGSSE